MKRSVWHGLTAREILNIYDNAPNNIARKWEGDNAAPVLYWRRDITKLFFAGRVYKDRNHPNQWAWRALDSLFSDPFTGDNYSSKEEAMKACDAKLIEWGWVLVN